LFNLKVRDVHKAPALDLVGWYTLVPVDGPKQHHVPVQTQFISFYPECTLLLGFHPSNVLEGSVGGKLPLTIYETSLEPLQAGARDDVNMNTDQPEIKIIYKEVPYTIETEDSEMIGVDFVARGGGNATTTSKPESTLAEAQGKGKKPASKAEADAKYAEETYIISREDEELIATLTAKANAIRMLHARISLLSTYLTSLPPGYVSGLPYNASEASELGHTPVNHSILRSIRALLIRLSLLIPADSSAFNRELLSEQNDVNLVNLLSTLTENIKGARETGRKFMVVETTRSSGAKKDGSGLPASRMLDMERIINASRSHVDKSRDHLGVGDLMG